jgi:hypothetical protein
MITGDYVIRMISQLVKVLQRVLMLKQSHNLPLARKELADAYRTLLGVSSNFVRTFPESQVMELFGSDQEAVRIKCYILGLLLKEEADLEKRAHRGDLSDELYARALSVLLTAFFEYKSHVEGEHKMHIEECFAALQGAQLPPALLEKLFRYYARMRRYDRAEDVLFELLASSETYRSLAISFFIELLQKSDAEIIAGGLTREEIHDALATIKKGA